MLCLRTFGGLGLERAEEPLPPHRPRRRLLALTALVAGHDLSGISRDKLMAYLWPEKEAQHARNSLRQALSELRVPPAIPLITSATGALRLDRALIQVDLWQFEAALAQADEARAVEIYRGPYLDGFHISGLLEFERWVEAERQRLSHRHANALRALAERAERSGRLAEAVEWWRRLTAAEPLCSTAALGLMRALAATGDSTAAREHARLHAAYVRVELGGPAAEAVVAFANQLRKVPIPAEPIPAPPWARSPAWVRNERWITPEVRRQKIRAAPVAATAIKLPLGLSLPPVSPRTFWGVITFYAMALLLSAFTSRARLNAAHPVISAEPATVAVAPFSAAGGPESAELGRGLKELLEWSLDGTDGLRTVYSGSPASQVKAARLYVLGQLIVGAGRLRASVTLYDRANANAAIGRAEAEREGNALFDLAGDLATQLSRSATANLLGSGPRRPIQRSVVLTPRTDMTARR